MPNEEIATERVSKIAIFGKRKLYLQLNEELTDLGLTNDDYVVITLQKNKSIIIREAFKTKDILKKNNAVNESHNTNVAKEDTTDFVQPLQ